MGDNKLKFNNIIFIFYISLISFKAVAFSIAKPGTEGLSVRVNSTDDVIATYQGNSAQYSNDLYLEKGLGDSVFIFNNHSSPIGSTVNLGSFSIGTELIFRLHVNNTDFDYFTGPSDRNPDDKLHARVEENWMPNETLVSFEDLFNGPFFYNDLSFSFTNVDTSTPPSEVPLPAGIWFFITGIIGLFATAKNVRLKIKI